jgi:hypothetical protein
MITPEIQKKLVRAFKKTICREMGVTNSSQIAAQTLPIAWEVAEALHLDPLEFVRSVGFGECLLEHKGYLQPSGIGCCL